MEQQTTPRHKLHPANKLDQKTKKEESLYYALLIKTQGIKKADEIWNAREQGFYGLPEFTPEERQKINNIQVDDDFHHNRIFSRRK